MSAQPEALRLAKVPEALRLADVLMRSAKQADVDDQVIDVARWSVEDAAAELRRLQAERDELLQAAKLVIAWYEAEDDHSKADFYQRMQMCRDAEDALRAAIAKVEGKP